MMMGDYVMVRTFTAGVFVGTFLHRDGKEFTIGNARRIWYWAGAATLSQLSLEGTNKPEVCQFPDPVPWVLLTEVVEVLPVSDRAKASIERVPPWRA